LKTSFCRARSADGWRAADGHADDLDATSFKPPAEIALWPPIFWPRQPTTANYTGAFQAARFGRFFANSVAYAVVCTLSVITTSLVAGSVFGKYRFPLRGFLFGLVLATAIVPFEAYMIPL
jgi:multiple sugar transport system permease protein